MNTFLLSGLSDWRYTSMTWSTHKRKPLIFATARTMRPDTHWMVCAPSTGYSFIISKCRPDTYISLYRSSLSSSDFLERIHLAAIRFVQSGSLAQSPARKITLFSRSRIFTSFSSIIIGQFAPGSFGLMISVKLHCGGLANRVSDVLVSLRYPMEIVFVRD